MSLRWPSITLVVLLILPSALFAQRVSDDEIPTFTYTDLVEKRDSVLGKKVRVKATHIYGFEWSFLCDRECEKRAANTWVEFVDEDDMCKGSKGKLKRGSDKHFDNRAEVVYVGSLSAGGFGHFGVYRYQFLVTCVEKFKKLRPLN